MYYLRIKTLYFTYEQVFTSELDAKNKLIDLYKSYNVIEYTLTNKEEGAIQ